MKQTETTSEKIFKSDLLAETAQMLKDAGLKVYYSQWSHDRKGLHTYFHFTDGVNIGYCEAPYYGGVKFSTVHKPCRECGTGYGLQDYFESVDSPTIKDAKAAFQFAPNWAHSSDRKAIRKYSNWEEYTAKNNSCVYIEF